jgi:hypothetical protein
LTASDVSSASSLQWSRFGSGGIPSAAKRVEAIRATAAEFANTPRRGTRHPGMMPNLRYVTRSTCWGERVLAGQSLRVQA